MRFRLMGLAVATALVSACAMMGARFPTESADQLADRVIDQVWGARAIPAAQSYPAPVAAPAPAALPPPPPPLPLPVPVAPPLAEPPSGVEAAPLDGAPPPPPAELPSAEPLSLQLPVLAPGPSLAALGNFLLPAAVADGGLILPAGDAPRLIASMRQRLPDLAAQMDDGAVGLAADGYVALRDIRRVPVSIRTKVRNDVANENADRAALYHELAVGNGQREWESSLRVVFAGRWIARAPAGWWYQSASGTWLQKQ